MAQFTLELRQLVESEVDIFAGWTFPIFDEGYRATLKQKIIDHFYFKEIGVETPGKFIFNLRTRLNEIMPVMNKRYLAMKLDQRILDNYDVTEDYTRDTTNNGERLFSDTPNGRLNLTDADNGKFLSEITNDSGNGTEQWTRHITGNYGVQTDARAINEYLTLGIVNVDQEVFAALNDLFMQVY